MQKTLKISLLDKVYTITTDEDEKIVARASSRITAMLGTQSALTSSSLGEAGKFFVLPLLQLAVELEKSIAQQQDVSGRMSLLEKVVSDSL